MSDDRHSGVEFGDLMSDLEDVEYPRSADDVIEQFGDREVTHANGSETVRELLEPVGDATYDSADGVRREMLNMIGEGSVGREEYTDRGVQTEGDDFEEESF
jgi:hypothetical protein